MGPAAYKKGVFMIETKSVCPECLSVVPAEVMKQGDRVVIVKKCESHGDFSDVYFSDSDIYDRFQKFEAEGASLSNPMTKQAKGCPYDCGLCPNHKTQTLLANIDLTNRCNFSCPICFANASKSGYIYEPTMEQIKGMMQMLRSEKPVPCYAVQFAGGEPTLRKELPEIIKMAREMGFIQIQIATNGMKFAQSKDYCRSLHETPLSTIYLQFDGVTEAPYLKSRGFNALPFKLKAIRNMRETGLHNVVLVPTLVNGVNTDQGGDIIRFAMKNIDIVRGVNFQPVSFTGRISEDELKNGRITIPDFLALLEKQTDGQLKKSDFYPVPCVAPISDIVEAWTGEPQVKFTVHPHCGCATYVFKKGDELLPITRFVDVDGLLGAIERISQECRGSKDRQDQDHREAPGRGAKCVDRPMLPQGFDPEHLLVSFLRGGSIGTLAEFHTNALFIGAMHFMDPYNLDTERLKSCGIHYATPDGRVIPFCSYNIFHRKEIEQKFAKPMDVEGKTISEIGQGDRGD